MTERNEVLKNYANLVANVWEDDQVLDDLKAEPKRVLNNFGFNIPQDAEVNLILRQPNPEGTPDTQVDMYLEGENTGVYDIIIPLRPDGMDLEDIPLQDEVLELVAGGAVGGDANTTSCCCCCPCCSSDDMK